MHRVLPPFVLLIAGAGVLSGCARLDTYNRPYTWHPSGVNAANIAAQVANPDDLIVGRGSGGTDAAMVVPGIQQLDSGQAKGGAAAGATGSGASGSGAGTGAGGGAS
jgi:type IV pilus biogenesis protein CpaD/CtpE